MKPVRTCVGCRGRSPRTELMRIAAKSNLVFLDLTKSASGRGAWIHPSSSCLVLAIDRKAIARSMRLALTDADYLILKEQAEMMFAKNE
ncbi:YlxR family protein [Candidatus Rhodoluna planktonica]